MAVALIEHQAGSFALEFWGKGTTLFGRQTPLYGEHSRLNRCPESLDHYRPWLARSRLVLRHRDAAGEGHAAALHADDLGLVLDEGGRRRGAEAVIKIMDGEREVDLLTISGKRQNPNGHSRSYTGKPGR